MINNIQILRALAVLMVIANHSSGLVYKYGFNADGFLQVGHWGAYGVDIFFVISGYIMAMIDKVKSKTPASFIKDRFVRIVPVYWIFTLLMIFMQAVYPEAFREGLFTNEQNISSMLFISYLLGYDYPTIYVGWSLELEMTFYAIFALCLFIGNQFIKISLLVALIFILSFLGFMRPAAVEFSFGILLYYLANGLKIENKLSAFWFIPLIVTLVTMLMISDMPIDLVSWSRPLVIGTISFAMVAFSIACVDLRKGFFTYIGDASYSIYLVQVFSLPIIMKLSVKLLHGMDGIYAFMISIIFTVLSGVIFHECVEKNIINLVKRKPLKFFNFG
ncbi:acyltransferase family protein [Serratia nevei]|jgi:exopolysaccharide production protein ExoZ|uniref:acyltransferase family protein n=1 Tax=Serratia nevei TaxID=2703794 RepID=UPI0018D7886D|nr:acyltransferase [Serratia marcescens]